MSKSAACLVFVGLVAGAIDSASAQSSQMPRHLDRCVSIGQKMRDESSRDPLNEDVIQSLNDQLATLCEEAAGTIEDFGEATRNAGPNEARLREPSQMAKAMAYQFRNDMLERTKNLGKLLDMSPRDRPDDFDRQVATLMTGLAIQCEARQKEWVQLVNKNEELRKWLNESLQAAIAMRNDAAKPGGPMMAAREQIQRKMNEATDQMRRFYDAWQQCSARQAQAERAGFEAWNNYVQANGAPPSNNSANAVAEAYRRLLQADDAYRQACSQTYEALDRLDTAVGEHKQRMGELGKLSQDIDAFEDRANPETITQRCTEFDLWLKTLEQEMKG